ncbi:MAG: PstS family phosphate ABC transporter substrate-binding protein [Pseudomonadota bacterium]
MATPRQITLLHRMTDAEVIASLAAVKRNVQASTNDEGRTSPSDTENEGMIDRHPWTLTALLLCVATRCGADGLPDYAPTTSAMTGTLISVGSDTMEPLLNGWATAFKTHHPEVAFEIDARGSGTAPDPLIENRSQLAPMSRAMSDGELAHFEARYGYLPTHFRVALDAIAVYVHRGNPLEQLTLEQVDGIFSRLQACGGLPIVSWDQLTPNYRPETRDGPTERIQLVGRNRISGTYEFFRLHALCGGEFRGDYDDQSDSNHVVWAVANDPSAIGFAGLGHRTPSVKMLKLGRIDSGPFIGPARAEGDPSDISNISSGRYPLSRFMYIYVNKPPGEALAPLVDEFLRFTLSEQGQRIVAERFFVPIDESVARVQRAKFARDYERSWWQSD